MATRFAFVLSEDQIFRFDSRAGTVTKDLGSRGDTTVVLHLSPTDRRQIEDKCRSQHLMRAREPHPFYVGPTGSQDPPICWKLEVWMDGAHKRFSWCEVPYQTDTPEWHAVYAVKNRICRAVLESPEYEALPLTDRMRL